MPTGVQLLPEIVAEARKRGVEIEQLATRLDSSSKLSLSKEQLRVVTRDQLGGPFQLFSNSHEVPVLVVDSRETMGQSALTGVNTPSA
jgi:hypothetical protein